MTGSISPPWDIIISKDTLTTRAGRSAHGSQMHVSEGIAVVGIAYKLPQDVEDDTAFWEVLENGKNLSSQWPESRMRAEAHLDLKSGKAKVS